MTQSLYTATIAALTSGQWSTARKHLDDLARTDNYETVPDLHQFASALRLTNDYGTLLQDRIDLVNSKVKE